MNGAWAVTKKELRSYFYSPVAYVLIGLFLFFMGIMFTKFVQIYQQINARQAFQPGQGVTLDKVATALYQNMIFLLVLLTPLVTMRLYAEEKRQQTLELLLTSPLTGAGLVVGKFLAAFILMAVMVGLSFAYPAFMVMWGNPDLAIIGSTYVGIFLALSCFISLGGLISAMTSSQAIAAVFSFIGLLVLFLLPNLAQSMNVRMETFLGTMNLGTTLEYISPLKHFNDTMATGLIFVKDIVYFVTFTGLMLFLTHRVVESNRWR